MELSKAEYILADLIILKCPIKKAFGVVPFMSSGNLLHGKYEQYGEQLYQEIAAITISRSDVVRTFLLKEKYLETIDHTIPRDILSDKGEIAREKGGHIQYKEWEKEQEQRKNIEDFPKKKWYIYEPLKYIIPALIGFSVGKISCNTTNTTQPQNQSKDTIATTKISQPLPKISDTLSEHP